MRLSLRPNANFVRYSLGLDRKEPGAVQFSRWIEVGLTKEGESFAAGSTTAERPKCIVTGGAATMTLTYQGRTFPICCTGCRDEFNENPEKYLKKASVIVPAQAGKARSNPPAPSRVSRFEDAFAGDEVDAPAIKGQRAPDAASRRGTLAGPPPGSDARNKTGGRSPKKDGEKPAAPLSAARAASLLRIGQNLEKSAKTDAALGYYRRIVKDYPGTPAAKTAAQRIQALEKR
jgi:YHS domain-containing protein